MPGFNFIGSAVLVLTTTDVDKSGASYYGEQGLHYLSSKGEGNIVILSKTLSFQHAVSFRLGIGEILSLGRT